MAHTEVSGPELPAPKRQLLRLIGLRAAQQIAATTPINARALLPMPRWWREVVVGVGRWQCFDATPTFACLPHVPARVKALTPNAKVVFMVGGQGCPGRGALLVGWRRPCPAAIPQSNCVTSAVHAPLCTSPQPSTASAAQQHS